MLKTGAFLQNRYEIVNRIGSGGMADVYKAKDHKLNRFVAVKVLKQEFRADKEFLSKFRVEAQSAAGLSHPNIVNVYDVGEDRGVNFIVMELVEGISLKNYISKKGKLSVREATSIALQVAAGLEAAHNNEVVHRDVKPQNILISLNGKVKIADFGIARAASSNTINSNAMGSVHYSSPEQTRGGYSDAKSDIYSMGITMYEMLTGRVPYDGDTTVEVALKHLQEEMPSPCRISPEVPLSTEQIILRCTQKSPDRRYANMTELIRDLKESLVNPDGDFVVIPTVDRKAQTVMLSKEEVNQIKNSSLPSYDPNLDTGAAGNLGDGSYSGDNRMYPYGGSYYQSSGYQNLRYNRDMSDYGEDDLYPENKDFGDYPNDDEYSFDDMDFDEDDDWEEGRRKARRKKQGGMSPALERVLIVAGIVVGVAAALVILGFVARYVGLFGGRNGGNNPVQGQTGTGVTGLVTVPSLLDKEEAAVQKELTGLNLEYVFQGEVPSTYTKGHVASQSVEAGTSVEVGSRIGYTISSGSSDTLKVPDLQNKTQEEANNALTGMGLLVSVDTTRYSDTVEAGNVITTNPGAGSDVASGSTVTIYVSQGNSSSMVEVPNVVGHYVEDASTALKNLQLYVYITEESSTTVEKGLVISQDIPGGTTVQTGTSVTLTASSGSPDQGNAPGMAEDAVWKCYAQLSAPEGWNGQPVRIVLQQGENQTTVFEGTTEFPFYLSVEGTPGVPTGTVYVYVLDPNTNEVVGTTQYDGVAFEAEWE